MEKLEVLTAMDFGQRVAEDESNKLSNYFVETDQWRRLLADEVDVVYGPKGSGKSALYALLLARRDDLFDRSIFLVAAENLRGTPAFKDLVEDPPTSEREFIALWKLYFASLAFRVIDDFDLRAEPAYVLQKALEREGLAPRSWDLRSLLRVVVDYARFALRPQGVEGEIKLDPVTGLPAGFGGKITFQEPSQSAAEEGYVSVDRLLTLANESFKEAETSAWLLLDRLDVAFAESHDLEQNALRALFKVYIDLLAYGNFRLKIFLRTDIWRRITTSGFREASHITRHITISWDRETLLNLVVRRAIMNSSVQAYYRATPQAALASLDRQEAFFSRMFPDQVDVGPNKPKTFDWILSRTRDGNGQSAPREVIHLLNSLREHQIRRLETGGAEPSGEHLFVRGVFKDALSEVSRVHVEQTLFAEYPRFRVHLEDLKGEKTLHSIPTLSVIWGLPEDETVRVADDLAKIGFFEKGGDKSDPKYWIPFLFRDALELVQGTAK